MIKPAQMQRAQEAYDALLPEEVSDDVSERLYQIEEAERLLAEARAELCQMGVSLLNVDRLMANAADCLIAE